MSVIIIPSSPKTKSHEFTGVTSDGREMAVKVTAAVDIAESAVMADLRKSMPGVSELKVKVESEVGLFGVMGILFFLWILFGFGVAFICMLLDGAGFIDLHDHWPEYVPIAGGWRIGRGMFRMWVAAIPLVSVVFPFVLWLFARKDLEAMQVGR